MWGWNNEHEFRNQYKTISIQERSSNVPYVYVLRRFGLRTRILAQADPSVETLMVRVFGKEYGPG